MTSARAGSEQMPLVGALQAGERSVKWDAGAGEMGFLPDVGSREGNIRRPMRVLQCVGLVVVIVVL